LTDIEVTLNAWKKNYVSVLAVQGESEGRTIIATITDRTGQTDTSYTAESIDRPVDLTDVSARLYCKKPDGTVTFSDGTVTDAENGIVEFVLPYQATTSAGTVECQILLTKSDNTTLKAIGLSLNVQESSLEDAVESSSEFSALTTALVQVREDAEIVEQAKEDSETALENANTAISEISAIEESIESAESARVIAENERQSNESTRQSNELARQEAEESRVNAESERQSNESARQAAEAARVTAENERAEAESERQENEEARQSAEQSRVTAESERVSAEQQREADTQEAISNANEATSAANTAAQNANEKATLADEKASEAETAAEAANEAAESANTAASAANTAAETANTAADRANEAAQNVDDAIAGNLDPVIDSRIEAKMDVSGGITSYDTFTSLTASDIGAIPSSEKGVANGVATLDNDGNLEQMPTAEQVGAVSKTGGIMTGILTAQSNTSYTVRQVRNIILSAADADVNAMQNGDIWIKYK